MSSLGHNASGSGNSIEPGIPGGGVADTWSKYPAVSDIDGGGYKLTNTDVDLCNDTVENLDIINSTLTGTTTLTTGDHDFFGRGIFRAGDSQVVSHNPLYQIGQVAEVRTVVGDVDRVGDFNEWSLVNDLSDGSLSINHKDQTANPDFTAIKMGNRLNENIEFNTTRGVFSDDLSVNDKVLVGGDLEVGGDITVAPGGVVRTKLTYPISPYGYFQSFTSGGVDYYMGEDNHDNPTDDQFGYALNANIGGGNDLGLTIIAKDGGSGTDTFENIATFYSSVNTANFPSATPERGLRVNGDIEATSGIRATGNISGDTVFANTGNINQGNFTNTNTTGEASCPLMKTAVLEGITGLPGDTETMELSGYITKAVFRENESGTFKGQWDLHQAGGIQLFANLALDYDVNTLRLTTANEFSTGTIRESVLCFAGGADHTNLDSYGIFCKNPAGNYVGFAHSEINGVKQYSFTAHHQSQYTGDITDKNLGMLVESTGRIVGLQAKDKLYMGISAEDPEYSNATPQVKLTSDRASKKVLGVISGVKDTPDTITGSLTIAYDGSGYNVGDKRVMVNAIGEGLVWVVNTNGAVFNGDLIQSSPEAGYAEKQDDDLMRSCTVGKLTMDCDFIQEQVPKKKILTDDDGENVLDSQGRLIWVNSDKKQDKYIMRYLPNGRKACLLPCVYYCG